MIVRELITKLGFNVDEKALDRYEASAKRVAGQMEKIGSRMSLFITAPLTALGALSLKAASDANEVASKFDTVFKAVQGDADAVAANLEKNFGLGSTAAKKLLSDTGDLLTGFGFTGSAALDLAKQTNELAVDLASFTNFAGGAEGASAALTKALLGERESVKSLGIAILEEDVKAEVAAMTARGMRFETERQAKAYATLAIAQRQSKNAIGDFSRTQDQLANRTRVFRGRIQNLIEAFGTRLIPIADKLLGVGLRLVEWLSSLDNSTKEFIIILAAVAAAAGPVIAAIGSLIGLVLTFGAAVLWVPLVIGALIAIFALLVQDIKTWAEGGDSLLGRYLGSWETFRARFMAIWDAIVTTIRTVVALLIDIFAPVIEAWKNVFAGIGQIIGGFVDFYNNLILAWINEIIAKVRLVWELIKRLPGFAKGIGAAATVAGTALTATAGVVEGADIVAAGQAASAIVSPAGNVKQDINVNLPPGTTAEQGEQVAKIAAEAARAALSDTVTDNPAVE